MSNFKQNANKHETSKLNTFDINQIVFEIFELLYLFHTFSNFYQHIESHQMTQQKFNRKLNYHEKQVFLNFD